MNTLTENDVNYLGFYLKNRDPITGSITPYDLSTASSIVFRMRKYGSTANAIETTAEIVSAKDGYCRVLVTIPVQGTYSTEIEVYTDRENITWVGPVFEVRPELG